MFDHTNKFVQVRVEEIAVGALAGLGVGLAVTSPITLGMPSLTPLAAGIGAWAAVQAGVAWAGGIAGGALGAWWMAHQPQDTHVDGNRYLTGPAATKALQAVMDASMSADQRAGKVHGLVLGGVEWARAVEVQQATLTGITGGGKSAILTDTLTQVLEHGDRVVLHDPSGDFVKYFYRPESTVILGAWDPRAWVWNAAIDIAAPALIRQFATATIGEVTGENKSFYQGAATLLRGTILALRNRDEKWTWRTLAKTLELPPKELAAFALTGDKRVATAVPSAFEDEIDRADGSKFSILQAGTDWIQAYGAVDSSDKSAFSFTDWLTGKAHKEIKLVILNSDLRYAAACEAIFGAILKSAVATMASPAMPRIDSDAPGTWFLLDEARQMGRGALESIQKIAELGRKRGVRVVTALQAASQLAATMNGEVQAKPMLAVQGTRIYLRASSADAHAASGEAGMHTIERIKTIAQNGATYGKTLETMREATVLPSAFTSLKVIPKKGVELIVQHGELYCRLFHPFSPRLPEIAPDQLESLAWINEHAEAAEAADTAAAELGLDTSMLRHTTEVDAMRAEGEEVVGRKADSGADQTGEDDPEDVAPATEQVPDDDSADDPPEAPPEPGKAPGAPKGKKTRVWL